MKFREFKHEPVKPDTYEASMALNQLMRIGKHAIKLHNMIDDNAEMESWVASKIDLAGDYVKKVYNYTEAEKAGYYEAHGGKHTTSGRSMTKGEMDKREKIVKGMKKDKAGFKKRYGKDAEAVMYATATKQAMGELKKMPKGTGTMYGVKEDAGEGHMSKSTLYHTAKYAIELMDMIKPGDDLEGWVQSKLNKAADYLQGAYNYEEYQKLNPYREELDASLMQKHAQVIQKNIDEILDKDTKIDDLDTKPGMMRILAKRVNEVEKEIAKETRKQNEGRMSDIDADMKTMSDEDFKKKYGKSKEQMEKDLNESGIMYRAGVKKYGKKGMKAIQSAAGKGASHQEIGKIKDKYLKDEELDEGLKDWAKSLAMAGIIVAGMAGVGSIQNAIDNSVPAVKAMNTAYEMAMDAGNTELADMIKNDISAVKVRLDSGRDLNFVKSMQDKYSKFMTTEGLVYESKLSVMLARLIK